MSSPQRRALQLHIFYAKEDPSADVKQLLPDFFSLTYRPIGHRVPAPGALTFSARPALLDHLKPAAVTRKTTLTIQQTPQVNRLKQQLRESLQRRTLDFRSIKLAKHENVYNSGDDDHMVYFIESGQIKLVMPSPAGKECLLAIYTADDIFGELCLADLGARRETATAMEETILRRIPCAQLFTLLTNDSLLQGFVQYLVARIADQQQIISNLVTVDSEKRLGETLLRLARKLGRKDIRSVLIEHRISHQELSEIVGTTRPRISAFMNRFRKLGLIERTAEHYLIVKEQKLTEYLQKLT